jgi:predicted O-methyltransferase YrrM
MLLANFNICKIRPQGFLPVDGFNEVIESLSWALSALGHGCVVRDNSLSSGLDTNIIFGSELMPEGTQLPPNTIIYQLEQPSHPHFAQVQEIARKNAVQVWDYSLRNCDLHGKAGIKATHVPIGYTPNLTRIPRATDQDIDVFMAGWRTPRREKLFSDLRASGLKAILVQNCYGGARDNLISRSKICLNVHHDGRDLFEIVRCSYLMANAKCVISEKSADDGDYIDLRMGPMFVNYNIIADACKSYMGASSLRGDREERLFESIQQRDYVATVAEAMASGPPTPTETSEDDTDLFTVSDLCYITPYCGLVEKCRWVLARPAEINVAVGKKALSVFSTEDYVATVAAALGPQCKHVEYGVEVPNQGGGLLRSDVIQKRYEKGCREGDMKDFLPWIRRHAKGAILEIGTRDGASTSAFLLGLEANGGHLTSLDISDCSKLWTHPQWTFTQINSLSAQFPDATFDMVLVDGDHVEFAFIGDLHNAYHWTKPGGLILVHDCVPERGHEFYAIPIRERLEQFVKEKQLKWELLPGKYGMAVVTR